MTQTIQIHGARQNNLADVDVALPKGQLTVVTGVSGSGKSSLAFDTLYAEGQRRYVESFSTYARQFLERMDRPDVDRIEGLLPAVALEQKNAIRSSRSTLGTLTEVTDYLKVLFARLATLHCRTCGEAVDVDIPGEVVADLLATQADRRLVVTFPFRAGAGEDAEISRRYLMKEGFRRILVADSVVELDTPKAAALTGTLDVVVDRAVVRAADRQRLVESIETAYRHAAGEATLHVQADDGRLVARQLFLEAHHCGESYPAATEGTFSFNSPVGACEPCRGFGRVMGIDMDRVVPDPRLSLATGAIAPWETAKGAAMHRRLREACATSGIDYNAPFASLTAAQRAVVLDGQGGPRGWSGVRGWFKELEAKTYKMHVRVFLARYRSYLPCPTCDGGRFKPDSLLYRLGGLTVAEVLALSVRDARAWLDGLPATAASRALGPAVEQLASRLRYMDEVGIGYLTLDRQARTLSGGEVQRANLTSALGSGLVNTLFVLDEPTIGLHPADSAQLADLLSELTRRDNTVVLVEHDPDMLRVADHIIEMGPGPGAAGGTVVYSGPARGLPGLGDASPTSRALAARSGPRAAAAFDVSHEPGVRVVNARAQNLKGVDVTFPYNRLTVVTGVSGSGKSTLVEQVLHRAWRSRHGLVTERPGAHDAIEGLERVADVVWIDQSPPQASSRANAATYVGAWDHVRKLFARQPLALERGYSPGTFSFNTAGGRCPACEGAGVERIEMQFLADVFVRCEVCDGKRFTAAVLEVLWDGLSIADVLDLTVDQAIARFKGRSNAKIALTTLHDVGLGYLRLGQSLATLSGGESQRLKLAQHIDTRVRDRHTLYLLDEPTTGLHLADVDTLIGNLRRLTQRGNTVVVVEHHLDVIAAADHIVDLGAHDQPGGGQHGGHLVFTGPPAALVHSGTATGQHLARWLGGVTPIDTAAADAAPAPRRAYLGGHIAIAGARVHNLKNVDLRIPRDRRTVISGVSGSGKSTLAFDIIFAEGQRRFLDCLSAYARQYIMQLARPDADAIEGIPPTVAIEQRTTRGGSRSSVANVTEIEPFLRLLYARIGEVRQAGIAGRLTPEALAEHLALLDDDEDVAVCAPIVRARQGYHEAVFDAARRERLDTIVNGKRRAWDHVAKRLRRRGHHDIDLVMGDVRADDPAALVPLLRAAAIRAEGEVKIVRPGLPTRLYELEVAGAKRSEAFDPRYFSPRTKLGACPTCSGDGTLDDGSVCDECGGDRLGPVGRSVDLGGKTLPHLIRMTAPEVVAFLDGLVLGARGRAIAEGPLKAIRERASFLAEVGLDYLGLDRTVRSLSGGEAQRIRLAAQLGAHLSGVLYVLDEPTIGLHPTDTELLLDVLDKLQARGNGIIMVEHDEATIRTADVLVDIGPGAGVEGGEILVAGPLSAALANPRSLTGRCLGVPRPLTREARRSLDDAAFISLAGVRHHNLDGVDFRVPRARLTVVSGVSGSGKSSLVEALTHALSGRTDASSWRSATGLGDLTRLIEVDDKPIGKNPRSTPATYVGVWDEIRKLFAAMPDAKVRGYKPGRFSFNVKGGRCEGCDGNGLVKLEMSFLPDAWVACDTCGGKRFNRQTLAVRYDGHSIHDVLEMSVRQALEVFERVPKIQRQLQMLADVGLGYLTLGQPSPTLSGGEAQRIKLVSHLSGRSQPQTVLILDEPTIGLHMADVPKLLEVVHRLVDAGATVVVVEHNTDVMREADWIIDMGPGAGVAGGELVYAGPYAGLSSVERSRTGAYLRRTETATRPRPKKGQKKVAAAVPAS